MGTGRQSTGPSLSRRELLVAAGGAAVAAVVARLAAAAAAGAKPLFALRGDGKVVVIDTATDTVVHSIETGGRGGELGALSSDGRTLFVANNAPGQRSVTVIDTGTLEVRTQLETGNRPRSPVLSPDGRLLAVNHSGLDDGKPRIAFLDPATLETIRTVEVPVAAPVGQGEASLEGRWSPDGALFAVGSCLDDAILLVRPDGGFTRLASAGTARDFVWYGDDLCALVDLPDLEHGMKDGHIEVWSMADPGAPRLNATFPVDHPGDDEPAGRSTWTAGKTYIDCRKGDEVLVFEGRGSVRLLTTIPTADGGRAQGMLLAVP